MKEPERVHPPGVHPFSISLTSQPESCECVKLSYVHEQEICMASRYDDFENQCRFCPLCDTWERWIFKERMLVTSSSVLFDSLVGCVAPMTRL